MSLETIKRRAMRGLLCPPAASPEASSASGRNPTSIFLWENLRSTRCSEGLPCSWADIFFLFLRYVCSCVLCDPGAPVRSLAEADVYMKSSWTVLKDKFLYLWGLIAYLFCRTLFLLPPAPTVSSCLLHIRTTLWERRQQSLCTDGPYISKDTTTQSQHWGHCNTHFPVAVMTVPKTDQGTCKQ